MNGLPLTYEQVLAAFQKWCAANEMDPKDGELRSAFLGGVMHVEQLVGVGEPS